MNSTRARTTGSCLVRSAWLGLAPVAVAIALSGCGGGGSDPPAQTLYVDYDYPGATISGFVFQELEVRPSVSGLDGRAATFSASGGLPPGLSLDAHSGVLSGTPTAAFQNPLTVLLTVAGYEGTLSSSMQLDIRNPFTASYSFSRLIVNRQVSLRPMLAAVQPGDQTTFTVEPSNTEVYKSVLPEGLTLDASTGEISGTPTTLSDNSRNGLGHRVRIGMEVRRGAWVTRMDYPPVLDLSVSAF